jgi:hypothetical protein
VDFDQLVPLGLKLRHILHLAIDKLLHMFLPARIERIENGKQQLICKGIKMSK